MKHIPCLSLILCLHAPLPPALHAETEAGRLWKTIHMEVPHMHLNDLAHADGQVIAVGENGVIRRSLDDGATWDEVDSPTTMDLFGVCWTGNEWIAVGGWFKTIGVVLRSSHGVVWMQTCLAETPALMSVCHGAPGTVGVGYNELVAHSADSVHWSSATGTASFDTFQDVIWTGSQYVGVGTDGLIRRSPAGAVWTDHAFGTSTLDAVAWNGTRLVAVGFDSSTSRSLIIHSTDGAVWTPVDTSLLSPISLAAITWTGNRFVASGSGKVLTSPDGLAWSEHDLPLTALIKSLDWTGTRLVAAGRGGAILTTDESAPNATADWTVRRSPTSEPGFTDLAMAEVGGIQRVVVVGSNGTIFRSSNNGESGTDHSDSALPTLNAVETANFAPQTFLAVGQSGAITTSPDGETWTSRNSGTTSALKGCTWHFPINFPTSPVLGVAVGAGGTIRASNDGVAWSGRTSGTTETLSDVASGLVVVGKPPAATRRLVAVGTNGTILSSSSGSSWTAQSAGTTSNLHAVTVFDNKFVAVGDHGIVLTSADAINWTLRNTGVNESLYDVNRAGDLLVAVGRRGVAFTSPDSINWTQRYTPFTKSLYGVREADAGRVLAVGTQGIVLKSDPRFDFEEWIAAQSPPPGQDDPDDDPNRDGITNLVSYAHGIPAVSPSSPAEQFWLPRIVNPAPNGRIRMFLVPNTSDTPDLTYVLEESFTMAPGSWTEILRNSPGQPCSSGVVDVSIDPSTDGAVLVLPEAHGSHPGYFLRVRYELE